MFKTFRQYALLKETANRSISHLLAVAHSNRLMVVISSFREGRDQSPPRSAADLQRDIRSQRGFEIIPNPECEANPKATPEIEGPNVMASLPPTGQMGITKGVGGFKEKKMDGDKEVLGDDGQPIQYDVCEDSLVVSHKRGPGHPTDDEVIEFFKALCRKYRQESFLFKSPESDEVQMISATGSVDNLGAFDAASTIDQYFTRLRKGPNYNERRVKAAPKPTASDRLGGDYGF